jgi:CRISPR-associated endonuclease Csn1
MRNHLFLYNEDINGKISEHPEFAFAADGIDEMNKNMKALNGGKPHQPIYKVRTYEPKGNKFNVGITGNKKDKYVETAKGTNLYFAIYQDLSGNRKYESIPLNVVVERLKQSAIPVPEKLTDLQKNEDIPLLFFLSPNDLVYVPADGEFENNSLDHLKNLTREQSKRIYKFVSCTDGEAHFVPHNYAAPIVKNEMGSNNKSQNDINGLQIKKVCIKLKSDRLGNLIKA